MTELICITCPKGCHLRVDEEKGFACLLYTSDAADE